MPMAQLGHESQWLLQVYSITCRTVTGPFTFKENPLSLFAICVIGVLLCKYCVSVKKKKCGREELIVWQCK